jgi:hypothetical protein
MAKALIFTAVEPFGSNICRYSIPLEEIGPRPPQSQPQPLS